MQASVRRELPWHVLSRVEEVCALVVRARRIETNRATVSEHRRRRGEAVAPPPSAGSGAVWYVRLT